jgi:UDP-N-acetylglucosamine acyltransferase
MGRDNLVYTGCVLGERPQHLKYADEPTGLEIGDCNQFREYVTVHRGTSHAVTTRIGDHNFFMINSHVAHDCQVGNHCVFSNGALLAGHCVVADHVFLSGNTAVHQFVRIGRLALLSGVSASSKDIPPFAIQQGFNLIAGVNVIGMRRAGISNARIDAVRTAYHLLFRGEELITHASAKVEQMLGTVDVVAELLTFIRQSQRGVTTMREHNRHHAA